VVDEGLDHYNVRVTVATFADIGLHESGKPCAGGAFEVVAPPEESAVVHLDPWTVEVKQGQKIVVARGGSEGTYKEAVVAASLNAQAGLDVLSYRYGRNLSISRARDEHVVWWPEPAGIAIRVVSIAPARLTMGPIKFEVRDSTGAVVPRPPEPRVIWHESFRYFRVSQITDDLFDAYRNAYLALESILSTIAPPKLSPSGSPAEGEGKWFERALREADKLVPLTKFVPTGTADPVSAIKTELYEEVRSAMSHAKSGRPILLPRDEATRRKVAASLQRLVAFYLQLIEAKLGVRRSDGGVFEAFFRTQEMTALNSMTVVVSDDETPFQPADTVANPAGGAVVALEAVSPAEAPESFLCTRLFSSPRLNLATVPFIRRIVGMASSGEPWIGAILEGSLLLGDIVRFEAQLGVRGENVLQPRQVYPL
jgi:hypothetical protein